METRVAVLAIIIEQPDAVPSLNTVLHDVSAYIIGRMGLPYPKRGIHIISIAMDAPQDVGSPLWLASWGTRKSTPWKAASISMRATP